MAGIRRSLPFGVLIAVAAIVGSRTGSSDDVQSAAGKSTEPPIPLIVSPPNRSVLLSGNFDVIYRGDDAPLKIDSREREWESSYVSPVRVGRVRLSPGMHRVQVGEQMVELCVALNEMEHDGPADWRIFKIHTMSPEEDRCAECHELKQSGRKLQVGKPQVPQLCFDCHLASDIEQPHEPFGGPPKLCTECHNMHGSAFPSLLKAPKEEILAKHGASAGRSESPP